MAQAADRFGNTNQSNSLNAFGDSARLAEINRNAPPLRNVNIVTGQPVGGGSPAPAPSGGGGGGEAVVPSIDPLLAQLDEAFNARIGALDSSSARLKAAQPGIEGDINQEAAVGQTGLQTELDVTGRQLDESQTQGEGRKEDALTKARRLFNELNTGGQQRFGGASSAGEAFGALTGREFQRNTAQIGSDFEGFARQIQGARTDVKARFDQSVAVLEQKRESALNASRRFFQDKLHEIDLLKSEAAENKALRRLSALQDFRNQVFQVNLAREEGVRQATDVASTAGIALDDLTNEANTVKTNVEAGGVVQGESSQQASGFFSNLQNTLQNIISGGDNAPVGRTFGTFKNDEDEFLQ